MSEQAPLPRRQRRQMRREARRQRRLLLPTRPRDIALDFAERAGWTAGQQFLAVLLATTGAAAAAADTSVVDLPWQLALTSSLGAAVASVPTTAALYLRGFYAWITASYWRDLITRVLKTFTASVAGTLLAVQVVDTYDLGWRSALDLAAIATLQCIAKGVLAREPRGISGDGGQAGTASTLSLATIHSAAGHLRHPTG